MCPEISDAEKRQQEELVTAQLLRNLTTSLNQPPRSSELCLFTLLKIMKYLTVATKNVETHKTRFFNTYLTRLKLNRLFEAFMYNVQS